MTKRENDAVWTQIEVGSLSTAQQAAYGEYKRLYAQMKEARGTFQASMAQGVPAGSRMIFGYNFGKLNVAIVADDAKPVKAKASVATLAEFLAQQGASGRAA